MSQGTHCPTQNLAGAACVPTLPSYLFCMSRRSRTLSLSLMALLYAGAGIMHFVKPKVYAKIVPPYLPVPLTLVYVSGVAELAGGLGLLLPATRRPAAWGLLLLLLAVFPANVYMARHNDELFRLPTWMVWARLPLQLALIGWAWQFAQPQPRLASNVVR
ncbi:DoxX family protein [Hymenobacter defluvii]